MQQVPIADPPSYRLHQFGVRNAVEIPAQVRVNHIRIARVHKPLNRGNGVLLLQGQIAAIGGAVDLGLGGLGIDLGKGGTISRARGLDILLQFLIEAMTLSVAGGMIGIVLGVGGSRLVSSKLQWPTLISPESIIGAFVFSAIIGIFFGFYPARKAAQLDPIEALRYE